MLNQVSILIKTFERPWAMNALLNSLKKVCWEGQILIVDDSLKPVNWQNQYNELSINQLECQYNIGLSAGRNLLLSRTKTPYFMLFDDDFVCCQDKFDINLALNMLENQAIDLLAFEIVDFTPSVLKFIKKYGRKKFLKKILKFEWVSLLQALYRRQIRRDYVGNFQRIEDVMRVNFITEVQSFLFCDLTSNFFLARTDRVKELRGWDANLPILEHYDFFLRAKQLALRVAYSDKISIKHIREPSIFQRIKFFRQFKNYLRGRYPEGSNYKSYYLTKFGLKDWVDFHEPKI